MNRASRRQQRAHGRPEPPSARPRQLQEPSQILGLASKFLTNGGDLSRLSLRFKASDQAAQPRAQLGGAERIVIGEGHKIAEQSAEPAQPARP